MALRKTPAKGKRRAPAARVRSSHRSAAPARPPAATGQTLPQAESGPARGTCRLQGPLLIHDVTGRAAELRQALDAGIRSFDLGGVSAIDTAGVQLLVALAQEAARCRQPLTLRGCANVVLPATRALGLAPELEPLMTEAA